MKTQQIWTLVTGKIALSATQHRLPRRELLDAQPTTSAEHDLVSVFGILWHHMDFHRKAFSLPRLWSKYWSKKKGNPTLPGYSVRGGLGHGYSAVLSTNDTSAQEQSKKNSRTKTESGSTAAANRMWRHFFTRKKKSFSVPRVGFKCKPCVSETELRRDGL